MYECEIEILKRCQKSLMCEKGHGLEQRVVQWLRGQQVGRWFKIAIFVTVKVRIVHVKVGRLSKKRKIVSTVHSHWMGPRRQASLTVTSITWKFRHGSNDPLLGYGPWPLKCEGQENVNLFWQLAEWRSRDAGTWKFFWGEGGGASSKEWVESAPPGWNRVNWSFKYWGGPLPRFRHHCEV